MNPNKLQAFFIDLIEAAVLGAAIAAIALPDSVTTKQAVGLIAGAAVGALKGFARAALVAYVASRKTPTP